VDREDQSQASARRFRWARTADASLRRWFSTPLLAFADAAHDGYDRLPEPVRHRRLIFWVARRYWLVYDVVTGLGRHVAESFLHFAPGAVLVAEEGGSCSVDCSGSGLRIIPLPDSDLEAESLRGETEPPQGWVSCAYGRKQAAPVLVYRRRGAVPLTFGAILVPYERRPPAVRASRLEVVCGGAPLAPSSGAGVCVEHGDGTVDYLLWRDGGAVATAAELMTDADVALLRLRPGEPPLGLCAPRGWLRWRGEEVASGFAEAGP
jgi:hypothetical protein